MSKYMLKPYINHNKYNCMIQPIYNKIMIKKRALKLMFTYIITLFFNNLFRCNLCQNHEQLYKLYKYNIKIVIIS